MVTKKKELKSGRILRQNCILSHIHKVDKKTLLILGTYFNPLALVNISSMGTFIKQRTLMVIMLVGNVPHWRHPFCSNQFFKALQMVLDTFNPLANSLTAFLFTQLQIFFPIDLATCQMSKKCAVLDWHSQRHLAIPLCRSDTKTAISRPTDIRYAKALLAPSSSIWELPPVLFAWLGKENTRKKAQASFM